MAEFGEGGVASPMVPVTQRLRLNAAATPHRIAYTFLREDGQAEDITCAELARRVHALAAALAARVAPGARAVLLYPAGLEFIVAYFACLCAAVVAVPATMAHGRRAASRLQALMADAGPALVLTTRECEAAVAATLAQAGAAGCARLCSDAMPGPGAAAAGAGALPQIDGALTAFLQYTSGSTAQPKGVEVTHANIASNVEAIRRAFGFRPDSVMVSWLPLFHDMGLIGSVVAPSAIGFRCVLMAPATFLRQPLRWLEALSAYRGTCAGAPNFGWDYCVRRITDEQKAGLDLSSLEVAYNGAEPVRAATLRQVAAAFGPCGLRPGALFACYGMAETTLLVAGGPRGRLPRVCTVSKARLEGNQLREVAPGSLDAREIVSCGPAVHGVTVLVVDPDSALPVAPRRIGEIWVAGPGVARGYWQRAPETAAVFGARAVGFDAAFLRTGDLGFVQDGELFVTGRLKDLLIVNGRNLYPQDVEEVIERAVDFIEPNMCAAFACEAGGTEQLAVVAEANRALVRAVQQAGEGARLAHIDALAQQIRTAVAQQFGVALASIVFVRPGSFPRTTSGKVQRARCRALARAGELEVVYASPGAAHSAPSAAPAALDARDSRASADALIAWLRQYAARRVNSRLIDERRTIPPYVILDLGNQGFFGLQAPRECGGRALATADLMRVLEQLAAVDLTVATVVGVHNGLGLRPLLQFGPAALQRRLLPQLASGRRLAAYALTEPQAGANPLAMGARAVRSSGGWRVTAEKHLIGLASWAGLLTVLAKAFDAGGTALGAIALLVPEDAPGLAHGPEALTMGMRGMVQNTVLLDDVFVPDEMVLLAPGEGMDVARDAMGFSRLGIGALCVGALKRCAQLMARYAARREIATGRLADNPVTVARLHELTCAVYATEALVAAIAAALDARAALPQEACLACKCVASELLGEGADRLVQLLGGRGYLETNLAPQLLRDARVLRILEGPTEALYMHLGASAAVPGNALDGFIGQALGRPQLAVALAATLGAARALGAPGFGGEAAAAQWLDYRTGELAAWTLLLAAAEQRAARGEPGSTQQAADAVAWARRRIGALRQALGADQAGGPGYPPARVLLARIGAYAGAIGDLEQALAGEAHGLDPLLRQGEPAPDAAATAPPAAAAGAPWLRAPASTPTRQLVHDSVLKWLRSDSASGAVALGDDTPFTELGMDSLAAVPIALELEQQTALPIMPELLYDHPTVNALAAYIDARRAAPDAVK